MDLTQRIVAGERVSDLVRVFPDITTTRHADGSGEFHLQLAPGVGDPFLRALLRIEAELLLEDSDGPPEVLWRAPDERRADALVELFGRLQAIGASAPSHQAN